MCFTWRPSKSSGGVTDNPISRLISLDLFRIIRPSLLSNSLLRLPNGRMKLSAGESIYIDSAISLEIAGSGNQSGNRKLDYFPTLVIL